MKQFLRRSFTARGFIDYKAARRFAQKMDEGVSLLDEMLEAGHSAVCVELAEYAMRLADKACQAMDDSDGYMTPIFRQIESIHRVACERSVPDPKKLAQSLFELVTEVSFSQFWECLDTHRGPLGTGGRNHFRKLVEAAWEGIPPRRPTETDARSLSRVNNEQDAKESLRRSAITYFMERFAKESGDIDLLVSALERDLRYAHDFSRICRLYGEAGRLEEALHWALKGMKVFSDGFQQQPLIVEALKAYVGLNQIDEALDLAWKNWQQHPRLEHYRTLHEISELRNEWPVWRERAHEVMWNEVVSEASRPKSSKSPAPLRTTSPGASIRLVAVLLWEEKLEDAWKVAQQYGCSDDQLRTLARYQEAKAPLEAVAIYQRFVTADLSRRDPKSYSNIAGQVEQIGTLLAKAGKQAAFARYLGELRSEYRRLRNFMEALDQQEGIAGMEYESGNHGR